VSGWTIDVIDRVVELETINAAETGGDMLLHTGGRGFVRPTGCWHVPGEDTERAELDLS
jgi:hypothetical protein